MKIVTYCQMTIKSKQAYSICSSFLYYCYRLQHFHGLLVVIEGVYLPSDPVPVDGDTSVDTRDVIF